MSKRQTDLDPQDQRFVQQAKRSLDQSVSELDHATALRVQRARLQALDAAPRRKPWQVWAGGLAVASMAALTMVLWFKQPVDENHRHGPLLDDLELVTSVENVELAEDLEFYDWLADATTTS